MVAPYAHVATLEEADEETAVGVDAADAPGAEASSARCIARPDSTSG